MIDILCANNGRISNLRRVTFLVLDEAGRMFNMGFEPLIMRIINDIGPYRQTVFTSETYSQVFEKAACNILQNPIEISMDEDIVTQYVEVRDENTKFKRLIELITHWFKEGSILVFVHRQESADSLEREISKSGYAALSLHIGKDQVVRTETIEEFKKGIKKILVATSIVARGLDVSHLRLVVNYDVSYDLEDYLYCVSRAGWQGTAYTFITPEEAKYAKGLVIALQRSNAKIPAELQALSDEYQKKIEAGEEEPRKVMLLSETNVESPSLVGDHLQPKEKEQAKFEELKNASEDTLDIQNSHFTTEIEINDYPQTARWKVTHKDTLSRITEDTECAITVRGQFCAPGKVTAVGERKLYLSIEGFSMDQVNKAKLQIQRVLEEATHS
eukprot:TRINITY_DN3573_c0_g2_i1.p1 TRINITY_DN3573_c0_g2~~TRINITY_DN3573_c0_g2_i1.p1  ORF type:complete len:387 (+),score=67.14 TRINITY_DN3573_c0_g2_i1:171-1331(+)